MTLQQQECLVLKCDGCGDLATDYDDTMTLHFAVDEPDQIREYVRDCEWSMGPGTTPGGAHFCPSCTDERREQQAKTLVQAGARSYLPELTPPLPGLGGWPDHIPPVGKPGRPE